MVMMTREDQLNVLELLPVWQLKELPAYKQAVTTLPEDAESIRLPQSFEANSSLDDSRNAPSFTLRQFVSEDGNFTFLLANMPDAANQLKADILLQNMFKAMKVTCRIEAQFESTALPFNLTSKVLIVMGERVANGLLKQSYDIAQWRALQTKQTLQYHTTPVVVTYCLSHLLSHGADKANAWADLCATKVMLRT